LDFRPTIFGKLLAKDAFGKKFGKNRFGHLVVDSTRSAAVWQRRGCWQKAGKGSPATPTNHRRCLWKELFSERRERTMNVC
jgi:hypothetical protein